MGLDVGTTRIKAAAFGPSGRCLARARVPAPPLTSWNGLTVQDPLALEKGALSVLASVMDALGDALGGGGGAGAGDDRWAVEALALTGQRDTLLRVRGPDARPESPLLSWRERRHLNDPEARRRLLGWGADSEAEACAMTLEAWLAERWRSGPPLSGLAVPPPRRVGGDKNCEYLAMGATPDEPGLGVVSLGSAISLAVAVGGGVAPRAVPGVVVTPGAGEEGAVTGWNVETGVLSGMSGLGEASVLAGVGRWTGPLPLEAEHELECVPHFRGALDDLLARPRLQGGAPEDWSAARVARAWAQGVAAELARLRPRVEEVARSPMVRLRITGGAADDPAWGPILGEALGLPWERCPDPWAGCRGAVMALDRSSSRYSPGRSAATLRP